MIDNGLICGELDTVDHCLLICAGVRECGDGVRNVISRMLGCRVSEKQLLCLSLNCRNKSKLKLCLWFWIKSTYKIFEYKVRNLKVLWRKMLEEIGTAVGMQLDIGTIENINQLNGLINADLTR